MISDSHFERRIDSLDITLFDAIPSQTSRSDKKALLAIQRAARNVFERYVYLEVGSHIGGSIQPHLLDPGCEMIYSIDSRPHSQPDERGIEQVYPENSTENMLAHLRRVAPDRLDKLVCFESRTQDLDRALISKPPHVSFIDGEHTDRAVQLDFEFCLSVADANGVIVFHDADLVAKGIKAITDGLRRKQIGFRALKLSGSVYAIGLGDCAVLSDKRVRRLRQSVEIYFLKSRLRMGYRQYRNRGRASS